jgi:hypothetical protein
MKYFHNIEVKGSLHILRRSVDMFTYDIFFLQFYSETY